MKGQQLLKHWGIHTSKVSIKNFFSKNPVHLELLLNLSKDNDVTLNNQSIKIAVRSPLIKRLTNEELIVKNKHLLNKNISIPTDRIYKRFLETPNSENSLTKRNRKTSHIETKSRKLSSRAGIKRIIKIWIKLINRINKVLSRTNIIISGKEEILFRKSPWYKNLKIIKPWWNTRIRISLPPN